MQGNKNRLTWTITCRKQQATLEFVLLKQNQVTSEGFRLKSPMTTKKKAKKVAVIGQAFNANSPY